MDSGGREFGAPWGTMLRMMSIFGTAVLLAVPVISLVTAKPGSEPWISLAVPAACLAVLLLTLLFTVRGYVITGDALLVRRLLWNTRLDLAGVRSARVDRDAMSGCIRTLGNGGLFSFSGRYRSRRLGKFRAFVTDMSNCVLLDTDRGPVVISPDNPEYFVEMLRQVRPGI